MGLGIEIEHGTGSVLGPGIGLELGTGTELELGPGAGFSVRTLLAGIVQTSPGEFVCTQWRCRKRNTHTHLPLH